MGQRLVKQTKPQKLQDAPLTMTDYALAGAFSAIPTTIITTPMERIKVVMQTQDQIVGGKKYTGMLDAGAGMMREGGIASLYRGTIATVARDAPGSAAYFVAYEYFYQLLKPRDGNLSIGASLFAGAMWSIAIPPDVIKSRIQAAPAGTYRGFMDCATKVMTQEGPQALFKGLGPALLRAFPANAAAFVSRALCLEVMHMLW
ncbi:carnitine transporter [Kappamyces sp. JEL0829]|nr:carnitine transporter [Kappamyces sp. JEL0829]